jgi:hypothetical protein
MRLHLLAITLALGSVFGCSKSPSSVNAVTPTPTAVQVRTPTPLAASSRNPQRNPASATPMVTSKPPRVRHLAPEGSYFLLQFVSITTQFGVVGLPPGTRITRVAHRGELFDVSDANDHVFQVTESQITNDVDLAAAAARRDAALQRHREAEIAADIRKYDEEQAKQWAREEDAAKKQRH